MRSDFETLKDYLLNPNLSESEFKKLLLKISSNFTSNREKINKYVLSPQMVSAYALFYIPTNYPKLFFLMNQLPIEVREVIKKCDFIDIGTGPGTYLLSFLVRYLAMISGQQYPLIEFENFLSLIALPYNRA